MQYSGIGDHTLVVASGVKLVKQYLLLVLSVLVIASTFSYAQTPGHYAGVVIVGILVALQLFQKSLG